jgi:hypothetical protein
VLAGVVDVIVVPVESPPPLLIGVHENDVDDSEVPVDGVTPVTVLATWVATPPGKLTALS